MIECRNGTPEAFVPMVIQEQAAIERVGGMKDLYRELLEYALEIQEERWANIEACIADEDFATYQIQVHALKGAMLSLGLEELAAEAGKQEEACRQKRYEDVRRQHADLARQYERGHRSIACYLSDSAEGK